MTEIKIVREDEKATAILKAIRQIDEGAELEPVVRCKDCINYSENKYDPDNSMWCKCWCDWLHTDPDDFCSYGERREGE